MSRTWKSKKRPWCASGPGVKGYWKKRLNRQYRRRWPRERDIILGTPPWVGPCLFWCDQHERYCGEVEYDPTDRVTYEDVTPPPRHTVRWILS